MTLPSREGDLPERPAGLRVLLADDQARVRSGFRLILESQPGITVAVEAADGLCAVSLARKLRPDVCLVDIRMPGLDGIKVTRELAGASIGDVQAALDHSSLAATTVYLRKLEGTADVYGAKVGTLTRGA